MPATQERAEIYGDIIGTRLTFGATPPLVMIRIIGPEGEKYHVRVDASCCFSIVCVDIYIAMNTRGTYTLECTIQDLEEQGFTA